ncbi:MAG: hypothetical protein AB9866_20465 [Syntrophobacteraceae bacterium]
MKLDLRGFQGYVKKNATIVSDDPANPRMIVQVEGTVKPLIWIRPEKAVGFQGMAAGLEEKAIDFITTSRAFHIRKMTDNLDKKAAYRLETIEDGKHYRLKVANNVKHGNYRGSITLHTDFSEKPELTIWINASIEGEIAIRPKTLVVGRLSPDQGVISGKVLVTNNLNKAFQIVRCTYDDKVISVVQSSLPDKAGFSLEITPNMENIPPGGRIKTTLSIETDVASEARQEVQVQAINLAGPPK